jgi:DNA-binding response OmpR family regulator
MNKRILLVDDDPGIRDTVSATLRLEGFDVEVEETGEAALARTADDVFDMLILDVMLPGISGTELCRKLRADGNGVPVIMLTAKDAEVDRVVGLELGADDYVTKPFSPKALVARVKALFRRLERAQEGPARLTYGGLVMDLTRHEVISDGAEISLTAKEFGLLEHLLRNPGRVLTRDALLNAVWGYDYYGTTRTVDVHIRRLKQKLPSLNDAIVSIKSLGYKLKDRG